jgi:hypothetical protein
MDYYKLNVVAKSYLFPFPFTESIVEAVARHELNSLMEGYSGYNQISDSTGG